MCADAQGCEELHSECADEKVGRELLNLCGMELFGEPRESRSMESTGTRAGGSKAAALKNAAPMGVTALSITADRTACKSNEVLLP